MKSMNAQFAIFAALFLRTIFLFELANANPPASTATVQRKHLRGLQADAPSAASYVPDDVKGHFYHGVSSMGIPRCNILWTVYTPLDERVTDAEIHYRIAKVPDADDNNGQNDPKKDFEKYMDLLRSIRIPYHSNAQQEVADPNDKHSENNKQTIPQDDDEYVADLLARNDVLSGTIFTRAKNNWEVKVRIKDLDPDSKYVFVFTDGSTTSPIGKLVTPRDDNPVKSLKIAALAFSFMLGG